MQPLDKDRLKEIRRSIAKEREERMSVNNDGFWLKTGDTAMMFTAVAAYIRDLPEQIEKQAQMPPGGYICIARYPYNHTVR